jgi:membrane protease YdiL (CAAX protease family)
MAIQPRKLVLYGALFGLLMILAAGLWSWALDRASFAAWFPRHHWAADLVIGTLAGIAFGLTAWNLAGRVPALRRMELIVVSSLDIRALGLHHAVLLGLIAGFPEEILFRGALQDTAGWLAAALVFGALHTITPTYGIYAALAGLLFGWLAIWRDGLWAPVAAHATIDMITFALLIRKYRAGSHWRPIMDDKQQILRSLEEEFNHWESLLAALSDEQITGPRLPGGWSIKDVMAHLWAWQQRTIARLEAAAHHKEPEFPVWPAEFDPEAEGQPHQLNAWIHATYKDKPWPEVYAGWREGFLHFRELAHEIPERDLLKPGRYSWLGGNPLSLVIRASYEHHVEHRGWLTDWLRDPQNRKG